MALPITAKKPEWLKVRAPSGQNFRDLKQNLREKSLYTVCEEARCPNIGECWTGGTATIMVMGDTCTRGCRFCNVRTGNPRGYLDPMEPLKTAQSLAEMGELNYVVITTVDRDDLPDQGASHFARIVSEIKKRIPELMVETLAQDFRGSEDCVNTLVSSGLDVFAHNIETCERLTPTVRDPRAGYRQSLDVLAAAKKFRPGLVTKTSIMLGLGETHEEILQCMRDARSVGVEIFTLGQYLRPTKRHLAVERFVSPQEFLEYERIGKEMGFALVPSGPLVRSSYRAGEFYIKAFVEERKAAIGGDVKNFLEGEANA